MTESEGSRIACIGWGSLISGPGTLQYRGEWQPDGPEMPVEFARESEGGKINLVICPDVARVRVYWVLMETSDLQDAKADLGIREYRSRAGEC